MECWEFMKCSIEVRGECPAFPDNGTYCWKVTGTMCDGGRIKMADKQEKIEHCRQCEFYSKYASKF